MRCVRCHKPADGRYCEACRAYFREAKRKQRRKEAIARRQDMPARVIEQALRRLDAARNLRRWTSES